MLWLQHTTGIVSTAYRQAGDPFGPVEVLSDSGNYNPVLAVGPKGSPGCEALHGVMTVEEAK